MDTIPREWWEKLRERIEFVNRATKLFLKNPMDKGHEYTLYGTLNTLSIVDDEMRRIEQGEK